MYHSILPMVTYPIVSMFYIIIGVSCGYQPVPLIIYVLYTVELSLPTFQLWNVYIKGTCTETLGYAIKVGNSTPTTGTIQKLNYGKTVK